MKIQEYLVTREQIRLNLGNSVLFRGGFLVKNLTCEISAHC